MPERSAVGFSMRLQTPRLVPFCLHLFCCLPSLFFCSPGTLHAQRADSVTPLAAAAPPSSPEGPAAAAPAEPLRAGTLTGAISDRDGALIPHALLSLRTSDGAPERTATSDSEGRFHFAGLRPGTYLLTASAPGFEETTSAPIAIDADHLAPHVELAFRVPASHADVTVSVTRHELATEEVHELEQQRVIGFPDFYTTYRWDAVPLNTGQKFTLAAHATTDPMAFVTAGLVAAGEQVQNTFPSFGGGFGGYAKRYGAAYTDAFVGKFIGSAIFPAVFRQDPRYFYMGPERGTIRQRARHAILSAVLTRGDDGATEPNYSHILGNAAAGAMSTLYHPSTDSAGKLALDNALLGTVGEAAVNLTREFLLKHFTRGLPTTYASDK